MSFNLRNRSLLTVQDFTQREFHYLLDLARDLKRAKYARTEQEHLKGKEIVLIFEKTSTRTRCAFEVACHDQGAHVTYLDPQGPRSVTRVSVKDTARVLGRMYDAIEFRGYSQEAVDDLARFAGVPVFNGLTDEYHPTQMVADVMTMREYSDKPLHEIKYAYIGDTRSNMGHSLMIVGCLLGMDVRICGPKSLWPSDSYVKIARGLEAKYGAKLTITDSPKDAVAGVDFVHTDVWVSMGEPKEVWAERESASRGAGVTLQLIGERLGILDQFQGVDQITILTDGSLEILERIEGGRHQVSVCTCPPALLGWATGNLPEPRNNPQIGMANMRTIMPALQKAKPAPPGQSGLHYRGASPPKQQRHTRIVKDLAADEVAREIADWITKS